MAEAVFDASALLAIVLGEPVRDRDRELLDAGGVAISAVNLAEVASRLSDGGVAEQDLRNLLTRLGLDVQAFDESRALAAASLRPLTRHLGLSLGDRACLALAGELNLPAVTADRSWLQLDLDIDIQLARPEA